MRHTVERYRVRVRHGARSHERISTELYFFWLSKCNSPLCPMPLGTYAAIAPQSPEGGFRVLGSWRRGGARLSVPPLPRFSGIHLLHESCHAT